jgi:SAM-dependent methyltransferase
MANVFSEGMERYWDLRAREDPFHYVDNRERLGSPNQARFWQGGEEVLDHLFGAVGVRLAGTESVAEIGCGIGRLTRALARRGGSVHALDISQSMLEQARAYNADLTNVEWIHGDGLTLAPLPDGAFDACVSFVVFQHLPTPELTYGYVREMGRVLRPGGWAAFQVSDDPRVHRPPSGIRRARLKALEWTGRGTRDHTNRAWLGSAIRIEDLRRAAQDGGLTLERIENQGTQFCFVLARRGDGSSGGGSGDLGPGPGPGPG